MATVLADWPKFKCATRWRPTAQPIKSGEEVVADMNYGRHGQSYIYSRPRSAALSRS